MERTIKTIPAENGELYVTSGGQRRLLARFTGTVRITEQQTLVPILGTVQKGTKRIFATVLICGDMDYRTDGVILHTGKVYDAVADAAGERLYFAGLRLADHDPIENTLTFDITDLELIQKLLRT